MQHLTKGVEYKVEMINMLHNEGRKLAVEAYEKSHNQKMVASNYSVSRYTIYRLMKRYRETGSYELRTDKCGRKSILTDKNLSDIDALIKQTSDITIKEIKEKLSLSVCTVTISCAIRKLGYVYKKKSLHATEQERPRCGCYEKKLDRKHSDLSCQ